jgi:hypothetical protein
MAIAIAMIGSLVIAQTSVYEAFGPVRGMYWWFMLATAVGAAWFNRTVGFFCAVLSAISFSFLSSRTGADPSIGTAFLTLGAACGIVLVIEHVRNQHPAAVKTPRAAIGWLPFIQDTSKGRTFWSVQESGDYSADCAAGANLASELVADIRRQKRPELLGWAVADMVAKGKMTGVEVGFMAEIGRSLADHDPDNATLQARIVKGQHNGHAGPVHE